MCWCCIIVDGLVFCCEIYSLMRVMRVMQQLLNNIYIIVFLVLYIYICCIMYDVLIIIALDWFELHGVLL